MVILDIGAEDLNSAKDGISTEESNLPRSPSDLHSLPTSPAIGATRYSERFENTASAQAAATPVTRLMKNLALEPKKRILTTVLFGENNPILAVGDNRGNVTVYRVFDPVTITNLGPLQQFTKLKEAVVRQTDPQYTALLESDDGGYSLTSQLTNGFKKNGEENNEVIN